MAVNIKGNDIYTSDNVSGALNVTGDETVTGAETVTGNQSIGGALTVTGLSNLNGGIAVATDKLTVSAAGAVLSASTIKSTGDIATTAYTPTVSAGSDTPPVYASVDCKYTYNKSTKMVHFWGSLSGDGGAEGAGSTNLSLTLPVAPNAWYYTSNNKPVGAGVFVNNATYGTHAVVITGANAMQLFLSTGTWVTAADQNNATRTITFFGSYEAAA